MAPISSLPTEIIQQIIGHIMPEDLENFAQTSKRIMSASASALQHHRQLVRKYSLISGPSNSRVAVPLLKDVLANPCIGHYVKKLELAKIPDHNTEQADDIGAWSKENRISDPEEALNLEQILAAVDKSKLLRPEDLDQIRMELDRSRWYRPMLHEDFYRRHTDVLVSLLLPLLPNLTVLSAECLRDFHPYFRMLERAKEQGTSFPSGIEHVHRQQFYIREVESEMIELCDFDAFLTLPSLRKLSSTGVWQSRWLKEFPEPRPLSNVTILEFRYCMLDSEILARFLEGFPHLQSFVYTGLNAKYMHRNNPNYGWGDLLYHNCDPHTIRAALQAQVPTTLRQLTILIDLSTQKPNFMGPLRPLKALEHIHSELWCILPNLRTNPKLIFPKSLRVLNVRVSEDEYTSNSRKLIEHTIQAKASRNPSIPLLETLIIEVVVPEGSCLPEKELLDKTNRDLQRRCEEIGLSLQFQIKGGA